ncbi:MAG: copper resistance protein CopC [Actinomycetota bacterium]
MRAAVVALVLAVVALVVTAAGPVLAHSGLAAASPGPGSRVGGEITEIRLFYADIITDITGSVSLMGGDELESEFVLENTVEATIVLAEPLSEPGEYAVRHTVDSIDGDIVEAAYLFSYDPAAPPPQFVFVEETDDGGLAWWAWTILGVATAVILVLVVRLVLSIRRARAVSTAAAGAPVDSSVD